MVALRAGRTVLWLRGDRKGIDFVKKNYELFKLQGIRISVPGAEKILLPDGGIAVLESRRSPEYLYYGEVLRRSGYPCIFERDPLRAVSLAITYPGSVLNRVVIGVDPGDSCGLVALGDGLVLFAEKINCMNIKDKIQYIVGSIPGKAYSIFVGDGQGLGGVLDALTSISLASNIRLGLVEEKGSTREPVRGPLASYLKDKDLLAGLTIAVRGGYSGLYEPLWVY